MTNQGNEVKIEIIIVKCVPKKVDWAKYLNRQSSKSIQVIKLSFCQNDPLIEESFRQNNSLVTHVLFELKPIIIFSPVANFGDQSQV